MASSSKFSTCSSPFTSSKFSSLPVMSLRERIIERVLQNRVTLIVGETGCGKSSLVPQFLLEENMQPILCTQPRRLAVLAVAKMVAKARNCELGGEVGYHIGHSKHVSAGSKIIFKTAGVLLDEMRDKGLKALDYKVIVLDEVHERSVESDLVLVCVKQFIVKNHDLRVVLMSATADIGRYKDYFKDLGRHERVEVLAIPSSNQKTVFQRNVTYLEQVTDLLGTEPDLLSLRYCSGLTPSMAEADIKPEVHILIHNLVLHIHENEPDIEKSILVFLPTYFSLENQWHLLTPLGSFKVHILHSSIDTEQALIAMKICKSHRKVILATNIAESSVTIPKVAYVIDSCRSLQVFWDNNRKRDSAKLVWVSKSQAEQRRGRTGRTCDGQVYRLITTSFFKQLEDFEDATILRLSLRQQVLLICCAESKAINDPRVLLQKALDPPDTKVVQDALDLLVHIKALQKPSSRGRYEPTFYGRLLTSFPLSFDFSVLLLKFGDIGMLHEGIILGILLDTQPLPILRPFGEDDLHAQYMESYFSNNSDLLGQKDMTYVANLCAFQFWQRVFKDKLRLEHLEKLLKFDEIKAAAQLLPKMEEEWCSFHNVVQSSLNRVSEIYEEVLHSIHQFRPNFLAGYDGVPSYYDPYEFKHTCLLECMPNEDADALESSGEGRQCLSVPFVASNHFRVLHVAEKLATIVKEIKVLYTEESGYQQINSNREGTFVHEETSICVFFVNGFCNRGSQCLFSHSLQAKKPPCRFFLSLQGCRNGNSCFFSHDLSPSVRPSNPTLCLPEDSDVCASSLQQFFPTSDGCILVLDDTDFYFSSKLTYLCDPSKIICTTSLSNMTICDPSLAGVRIFWGLNHPYQTIITKAGEELIPWNAVQCLLWFPNFESSSENRDSQKLLLQNFFEYLALRILADALSGVQIIITMNNLRFSQLQVEKLGRESFFFLSESFPFDERNLGVLPDNITTKKPMLASKPISYVFVMHPPSKIQFGDYTAEIQKRLRDIQKTI